MSNEILQTRRHALQAIAGTLLTGLAGCLTQDNQSDNTPQEGQTPPTKSQTQTATKTFTPINATTQPSTTTSTPRPQPPEPDIVVAKDGTGDYESFDLAHEAAESGGVANWGSVIKLKSGTYSGNISKDALIIIGADQDNTTLRLTGGKIPYNNQLWNLTVTCRPTNTISTHYNGSVHVYDTTLDFGVNVGRGGIISLYNTTVNGPINSERVRADQATLQHITLNGYERKSKPLVATDTHITGDLTIKPASQYTENQLTNCTVGGRTTFGAESSALIIKHSKLAGLNLNATYQGGGYDVTIRDTTLHASSGLRAALKAKTKADIRNSTITTANTPTTNTAIKGIETPRKTSASPAFTLQNNTIEGTVTGPGDGTAKWNTFKNPGKSFDWFIDGNFVKTLVGNAFIGADIRIDNPEMTVYNIDTKTGNYYSTYDKPDSDDDGIIDTARTLPGDANLVDEFPLASQKVEQYE